uniref:uncharacterized protein LOC120329860 n=1 Tax=Styela clava TaxID=7725 RepID=UPI001939920D|nr:uncharacterized protein LOC120329860 [Styela clava]
MCCTKTKLENWRQDVVDVPRYLTKSRKPERFVKDAKELFAPNVWIQLLKATIVQMKPLFVRVAKRSLTKMTTSQSLALQLPLILHTRVLLERMITKGVTAAE